MSFLQAVVGHEMLGERVSKANHSTAVIQSCFGRSGIGFLDEAMNARGHSQFSRPLPWCWQQKCAVKERRRLILLQDEYMSDPAEREAVNLLEFEAALLAGDPHRAGASSSSLSSRSSPSSPSSPSSLAAGALRKVKGKLLLSLTKQRTKIPGAWQLESRWLALHMFSLMAHLNSGQIPVT